MKTLKEICAEFTGIEAGLMQGTVGFRYEPAEGMKKSGHPVEIMDDVLNPVIYEIRHGRTPGAGTVSRTLAKLRSFRSTYGVEKLDAPLADLEAWLSAARPAD